MKLFKFGKKQQQQQQQRTQIKTRRINGWIYYFLLINIIYINSNVAFGVVFRLNAWRKACNGKRHQNLLPFRNCYEKTSSHSFACENIEATIRPHVASLAFCMWIFLIEIHLDSFFLLCRNYSNGHIHIIYQFKYWCKKKTDICKLRALLNGNLFKMKLIFAKIKTDAKTVKNIKIEFYSSLICGFFHMSCRFEI